MRIQHYQTDVLHGLFCLVLSNKVLTSTTVIFHRFITIVDVYNLIAMSLPIKSYTLKMAVENNMEMDLETRL